MATKANKPSKPAGNATKTATAVASHYETLIVEIRDSIALIALARPEVHNAFNDTLIAELDRALRTLDADDNVRAVVLLGHGKSFCAGADLNWMKRMAGYAPSENLADAMAMANMLKTLRNLSKPTIARVHGAAYGGGVGLVACCDVAIGAEGAKFSLSEVKLGLVPAVISPYVIAAIGARQARRWFQTGEAFKAPEAQRIGLVHEVADPHSLDGAVQHQCDLLLKNGPVAVKEAKALARRMASAGEAAVIDAANADLIARLRVSPEGQEGLTAFLDKRKPSWIPRDTSLSIPDT